MAKNSRAKGKRGELELAHKLREHGYSTRRGQQYSGTETSADVIGLPGVHIECKRVETLNIYSAIMQAVNDTGASGDLPAVFHRKNNQPWLVTMRLEEWLALYRRWADVRQETAQESVPGD